MQNRDKIALIIGIAVFFAIELFIPSPNCGDGWKSPSIGLQGACSHHGGVERHEGLHFLAFAAGVFTWLAISGVFSKDPSIYVPPPDFTNKEDNLTNREALIRYAIRKNKKIEFMYKKTSDIDHSLRIIKPKSLRHGQDRQGNSISPYVTGDCETRKEKRSFSLNRMANIKIIKR